MKKQYIKVIAFLLIVGFLFCGCQKIFTASNNLTEHAEMMMQGYYTEKNNTVDAVFIGNSHIYRYWQGAFGWEQYGITGLGLSTSDLPCTIYKNMVIEALKTQSPKVISIDALAFAKDETLENNKIYYVTSNMKFSKNYLDTIAAYCDANEIKGFDRLVYYFPSIQFHSRWKELEKRDFYETKESYLNSTYEKSFLTKKIKDKVHFTTDSLNPIGPDQERILRELLEWCQGQDACAFEFVAVPVLWEEDELARINYVKNIVQEYGFTFVDFNEPDAYAEFGFDENSDFQDINHTNVKGSYRFCEVYGQQLIDRYGLEDHRDDSSYQSWQERSEKYMKKVDKYIHP